MEEVVRIMDCNIWDGEMDCGWEDLSEKIKKECNVFADKMIEIVSFSPTQESKNLISTDSMERLCLLAEQFATEIKNGYYYQCEDIVENIQNASKMICWIILGSLTETVLQVFIAFYIDDYKRSQWQQWNAFPKEIVKKEIFDIINKLVNENTIDKEQGKSLKEAIKDNIKKHCEEHPVQRIMLDEIIQFYSFQKLFDDDEIFYIKMIQSNRNGIHSFENRSIDDWNNLQYASRFWCYLLEWILSRMPDIPD